MKKREMLEMFRLIYPESAKNVQRGMEYEDYMDTDAYKLECAVCFGEDTLRKERIKSYFAEIQKTLQYKKLRKFVTNNTEFTYIILSEGVIKKQYWHKNQYPGKYLVEYMGIEFMALKAGHECRTILAQ